MNRISMILLTKKIVFKVIAVIAIGFYMFWFAEVFAAQTVHDMYFQAEKIYIRFKADPKKMQYRDKWIECIQKFEAAFKQNPKDPLAPASLYMTGQIYESLFRYSGKQADLTETINTYQRVIKLYPNSIYASKAESNIAANKGKKKESTASLQAKVVTNDNDPLSHKTRHPDLIEKKQPQESSDISAKPVQQVAKPDSIEKILTDTLIPDKNQASKEISKNQDVTHINGLRYWSNPNYTRVVIDGDKEAQYQHFLLPEDETNKKPKRLCVDVAKSLLERNMKKMVPIHDNLLADVRAAQYTLDTVRVVVDIKSFDNYKIFNINNPFRIVIDVWGEKTKPQKQEKPIHTAIEITDKSSVKTLAKQLALGVKRIVIDPGHGGKDVGAIGFIKGIYEKHITLAIAKELAVWIKEQLNCEVILTRQDDRYLSLEERTAIANTANADLFISIHTNAVNDVRAYGIETYFLNLATDKDSISVAARENATSTKTISDLQAILNDLLQNTKINESSRLAGFVQNTMCQSLEKKYRKINNKGVKQAPFYVLIGAEMPAILIETSFISNPQECKRLTERAYQKDICQAISKGIKTYIKQTNPTAFLDERNRHREQDG
ncbi:MAG: N-acetylmuramoyl-L-alanine amidase [Desulfobacterales bacterium]|nr:N-acetylmuramoyl-L-alanine amidase [Desulfobacterales bacterium]